MTYDKPLIKFANIAITYYLADALPHLRKMSRRHLITLSKECDAISNKYPLHQLGVSKEFQLKRWHKPATGCYILALLAGALWVLSGENPDKLPLSFMEFWPITDALSLSPTPLPEEEIKSRGKPKKPKFRIKHLPDPVTGRKYRIHHA